MRKQFYVFIVRWVFNSLGLWVAVGVLGSGYSEENTLLDIIIFPVAGLVFSTINAVIRPAITILALPAILLTLGLFMLVINGLMVYLSLAISPGLSMTFGNSILAGAMLSLINYMVDSILITKGQKQEPREN